MSDGQTAIVGFGARTCIGMTAPSSAAAVRAGISGFEQHPWYRSQRAEAVVVASAPYLPLKLDVRERLTELVRPACREALRSLGGFRPRRRILTVLAVSGPHAEHLSSSAFACNIEGEIAAFGRPSGVMVVTGGNAAGIEALEWAEYQISSNTADLCLVIGVDSAVDGERLALLETQGRLHGPSNTYGYIPGEAAGVIALCRPLTAHKADLSIKASILATACADEAVPQGGEGVCLGLGLSRVFKKTLEFLPSTLDRVDDVICDMNGEPYRSDEFGFAMVRFSNRFQFPDRVTTPADCWGDIGAASGPLFVILACEAARRGYSKGPFTFVWASSDCGRRAGTLLQLDVETVRVGDR